MRVSLIKSTEIENFELSNNISNNSWITETDKNGIKHNLINIEFKDNNWYLISNSEYYFIKDNILQQSEILNYYQMYEIKSNKSNETFLLYCSPIYENRLTCHQLPLSDKEYTIGKSKDCDILYNSPYINDIQGKIIVKNSIAYLSPIDINTSIYVNNERIKNVCRLYFGDVIFVYGLKIIFVVLKNQLYLLINNPNNLVGCKMASIAMPIETEKQYDEVKEELDINMYNINDYFHRNPRFIYSIKPLEIKIDAPPAKQNEKNTPAILTIGPMLTMSMSSLSMVLVSINNVNKNNASFNSVLPSLITSFAMMASTLLWPSITRKYEKIKNKNQEKNRIKMYLKYIDNIKERINEEKLSQVGTINNIYLNLEECKQTIINKRTNLWEKRINDDDFLKVSLGKGNLPMQVNITYPEEHFSMDEDELLSKIEELKNQPKILENVEIPFSFAENKISAIYGNLLMSRRLIENIILQLITFHSYENLKLVIFTNGENNQYWEFAKILPHCWDGDKKNRYYAENNDEYKELCYNLEHIINLRKEQEENKIELETNCHYLVITDCFSSIRNYDFIKNVLDNKDSKEFSFIIINDKITNLPEQCNTFINIENNKCNFFSSTNIKETQEFIIDTNTQYDLYQCAKKLANIPIDISDKSDGQLPDKLGFLEMYDVGKVEQLNCLSRWKENIPILNMQAPIGIGKNGETIYLDLHEKYHGPHGLIAGMTGSGKSEFIITYILSMAIQYHPYEVQFILIDYKGGGLAGAFEKKNIGLKLPHLIGTITNLDSNEINRSLLSVNSELKKRQELFNSAREKSGESTIDIYKYQKMYRDGIVDIPISHLFIICDEFAELKQNQPDFMEELISTARIGRSLGVHLILATQKPSGVVDPQIWSNTRFRVCFRVQEKSDSNEVIQCPDAAFLKQTGRFYLQVGYNEIFLLGQSAWAGGRYIPSEKNRKTIDSSISVINNNGYILKNIDTKSKVVEISSNGEELVNILKYLSDLAQKEKITTKQLWLDKIPNFISVDNLIKKYNYQKERFIINSIIGEYDIPSRQEQKLLTIPFTKKGNVIVYGSNGTGKENLLLTMIYSTMKTEKPETLNYYILDFGAEILKCVNDCPLVGDIIYASDEEKIKNFYKKIFKEINKRKTLFANYNGNYYDYCVGTNNDIPQIIVILNNFDNYQETYPNYEDDLIALTRECYKYGIYFILTTDTSNSVRYKLKQNFAQIFSLQQNNQDDYSLIFGGVSRIYPSKIFGRGIVEFDEEIYEFQTAYVCEKDKIQNALKELSNQMKNMHKTKALPIPILPQTVEFKDIASTFNTDYNLSIGISREELDITKFNFIKAHYSIISGIDLDITYNFTNELIKQIIVTQKYNLVVINTEEYDIDNNYTKYYTYLKTLSKDNYNILTNEYQKPTLIIIIGIDKFIENIKKDVEPSKVFNDNNKNTFIFIDRQDKFRKLDIEPWYKNLSAGYNAIWIGSGFNNQYSIKTISNFNLREELSTDFCIVVQNGKPEIVKYISNFKIKEN